MRHRRRSCLLSWAWNSDRSTQNRRKFLCLAGSDHRQNVNSEMAPTIGNNVSIYTNAVVAGNITIGDDVKIGAGAVVMQDVPDHSLVFGNPCQIIKNNNGRKS